MYRNIENLVNTTFTISLLRIKLNFRWRAMGIHGDKSQVDRDYVLNQFRNNNIDILVATDVAARGLGGLF